MECFLSPKSHVNDAHYYLYEFMYLYIMLLYIWIMNTGGRWVTVLFTCLLATDISKQWCYWSPPAPIWTTMETSVTNYVLLFLFFAPNTPLWKCSTATLPWAWLVKKDMLKWFANLLKLVPIHMRWTRYLPSSVSIDEMSLCFFFNFFISCRKTKPLCGMPPLVNMRKL